VGDELCVAIMDLVILLDGSGSVSEAGFDKLKHFTKELLHRFKGRAYGSGAMKVSLVHFGNGELNYDKETNSNIVSSAITAAMFEDPAKLDAKLDAIPWSKGFTNLAQGFFKAMDHLRQSPRQHAIPAVLVITDGSVNFKYETITANERLKKVARVTIVDIKQDPSKEHQQFQQSMATKPWTANYIHINGKEALNNNLPAAVDDTLVEFCPRAQSPSEMDKEAEFAGWEKIYENKFCGGNKNWKGPAVMGARLVGRGVGVCERGASSSDKFKSFAFDPSTGWCFLYDFECGSDETEADDAKKMREARAEGFHVYVKGTMKSPWGL